MYSTTERWHSIPKKTYIPHLPIPILTLLYTFLEPDNTELKGLYTSSPTLFTSMTSKQAKAW